MRAAVILMLCLLFCGVLVPPAAGAEELAGLTVRTIELRDAAGVPWPNDANLRQLLIVKEGAPLSPEEVRQGLGYLYLTQQFRDIRVDAIPVDGGIRLVYTLFPVVVVDKVVLRGNHALSDRALRNAMTGIEGKELREETFPDIRTAIQALYQAEGYYGVRVNFRHEPSRQPYRAVLYVYITESAQTIIADITFKGNTVFPERELLASMRNRKGAPLLTNVLFDQDLEAIQRKYVAAGYPAAKPGPVSMSFQDGRAYLDIGGTEGPKVSVSFSGNDRFCSLEFPDLLHFDPDHPGPAVLQDACNEYFRDLLLIWSERDVSDTVIDSSVEKIENVYRDAGFADVKVEARKTASPGALDLAFLIHEGPRVLVREIRVEGNSAFTASQIRGMLATRKTGWFIERPFRQDALDKDAETVTDLYAAAGYLGAEVKPTAERTGDGTGAVVLLQVTEGKKTVTGPISFEGNRVFTSEELAKGLTLKPGKPYNERLVEEDRYAILSRYSNKGYLYARVDADKKSVPRGEGSADQPEEMEVHYRITEDRPVMMGVVILRGNAETRDHVILRELEPKTGEPYDYSAILKSQQRVYRYGYFTQARFEPVHPYEKEYTKDMLFTVEERPAGALEFGVGYGDLDRLRGFVEVSHRNLWGTARYASLRLEGSDILRRVAFTEQEPWFLGYRNLDGRFILAWSDAKRINQETRDIYYQTKKTSASYGVERTAGKLKTSLTYQYEIVTNYNVQQAAELTPEDSGHALISSLSPAVVWDLRDDPFNPTRGSIHGAAVKEALKALGSQADFTKVTVQTTWFLPAAQHTVLALSARSGLAWPQRDTLVVPIQERFYLGGSTTVRGFTQDQVGPSSIDAAGNQIPTGGSSMVQLNAEVRISSPGGTGIVFFTDAGNVWLDQKIRMDDLRASYGTGFRYSTPVGPLRIDYGQKIHRRPGESPGEMHFNIGHAF